ncbi:MAG: C4-dicarboxylate ABC transporter [Fimbriimonadaceae bacterium]|nr:C4-dicarboxylate ABC transporter [Chitinophagales bacterium]
MKRSIFTSPLFLLKSLASIVYLMLGIFLTAKPETINFLDEIWSRALGALLLVYGLFRTWRLINEIRKDK